MSLVGTVANYGGKQPTNTQSIKQFVVSQTSEQLWIYKKINGLIYQTPYNSSKAVYINNNLHISGCIFNSSNINLNNIETIDNTEFDKLLNLNSVKYNDNNQKKHYGFIAQEIKEIYPELVERNSINFIEFIPLLLSKIKKMQTEINELKTKVSI